MPRRSSWQLVIAATLLVLLAALATLQYRWLGQVSDAERDRLRVGLKTRASDFAADFDRELTRTYMAFRANTDRFGAEPAAFLGDALAQASAPDAGPSLVRDVYVMDADVPGGGLRRFDAAAKALIPSPWPPA